MVDVLCIIVGISEFSVVVTGFEDWKIRNFFYLGGLGLGLHSFWGTGGLWPLDWTASPFLIVVNQKGLSVLFLPKISAERVSALKYPFCLSAERLSFGRKALFRQKPALSAGAVIIFWTWLWTWIGLTGPKNVGLDWGMDWIGGRTGLNQNIWTWLRTVPNYDNTSSKYWR